MCLNYQQYSVQVGGAGRDTPEEKAETQQEAPEPATRPGEHHHSAGRYSGGWYQAC